MRTWFLLWLVGLSFANGSCGQFFAGLFRGFFWHKPGTLAVPDGTFELSFTTQSSDVADSAAHFLASFRD